MYTQLGLAQYSTCDEPPGRELLLKSGSAYTLFHKGRAHTLISCSHIYYAYFPLLPCVLHDNSIYIP